MNLDGQLDPPDPVPIGFCAVCGDEVYVWEKSQDGWGNVIHEECKGQEVEDE